MADEIGHISVGQVYAALAYYHANRDEIDDDLANENDLIQSTSASERGHWKQRNVVLRLYMDEDSMSRALVRALRARGVDVLTAEEDGMIERPDSDHLTFASREKRVLCTFNVSDFMRLHGELLADDQLHAGIVLMPQQRFGSGRDSPSSPSAGLHSAGRRHG